MNRIDQFSFKGRRALIRVDFNVPINSDGSVGDDTRIRRALPTIEKVLGDGGAVVLMSHLGRPKNGPEAKFSLKPVAEHLSKLLDKKVQFLGNCIGAEIQAAVKSSKEGDVLLLENLRFHQEEKAGDESFAKALADLGGDVYVNDAFGTAHRAHASTAVIARNFEPHNRLFGFLMNAEVDNAQKVLSQSEKPFVAILGGAKVSDKISIIDNLIPRVNALIIGGGMAYTFVKAKGGAIGQSLVEDDKLALAKEIIAACETANVELLIPPDSIIADKFAADAETKICPSDEIPDDWMGLDIGPAAIRAFEKHILRARTILWNGPMGVFEMEKFQGGTVAIARSVAEATSLGAFSLVGGGDSVAAVQKFELADQVSYVSTGGGAMLEFFEGKSLPGIQAILGA